MTMIQPPSSIPTVSLPRNFKVPMSWHLLIWDQYFCLTEYLKPKWVTQTMDPARLAPTKVSSFTKDASHFHKAPEQRFSNPAFTPIPENPVTTETVILHVHSGARDCISNKLLTCWSRDHAFCVARPQRKKEMATNKSKDSTSYNGHF